MDPTLLGGKVWGGGGWAQPILSFLMIAFSLPFIYTIVLIRDMCILLIQVFLKFKFLRRGWPAAEAPAPAWHGPDVKLAAGLGHAESYFIHRLCSSMGLKAAP